VTPRLRRRRCCDARISLFYGEAVNAYYIVDDDGDVLEVYSKCEDAKQAVVGEYFLHIEERWIPAEAYHCLLTNETEEHRLSFHRRASIYLSRFTIISWP
jgi:hypothetical protein